ncbi:response regulator [Candidatus Margulisiibacteriota bacterium]
MQTTISVISNPIFFISSNKADMQYFFMLRDKSLSFGEYDDFDEARLNFAKQSSEDINNTIIFVSDDLSSGPIFEIINTIRLYKGSTQLVVYSKNNNPNYVKEIMKAGADAFLELPQKNIFENLGLYQEWFVKIFDLLEKMQKNQLDTDFISKDYHNEREAWRDNLIKDMNDEIYKYLKENKTKSFEYLKDLDSVACFLAKETGGCVMKQPKAKILIVEDEKNYRKLIQLALKDAYDLLEAENGYDALQEIKNNSEINLVILDIMLPDTKGTELVKEIKRYNNKIEIIMLTAFEKNEYIIKSIGDGAFDYLAKPFSKGELLKKINDALDKQYYSQILKDFSLKLVR